jgi:hypothetical protein
MKDALTIGGLLIAFGLIWAFVISMIAYFGGWHTLAKSYTVDLSRIRPLDQDAGKRFGFASMSLGPSYFPSNYSSCLTIWVSDRGVELQVQPFFRFMHPPLFIPSSDIDHCDVEKFFVVFSRTAMYVNQSPHPLRIYGQAGRDILRRWGDRGLRS